MKIELDNQNKVVIASQSGKTHISDVIELINKAVFFSANYQCYEILFNMKKAELEYTFMEIYNLNKNLIQVTDLTYKYNCAVVYSPNTKTNEIQFYEIVGSNWGQGIFRIFFKFEEGIQSLKQRRSINNRD